MKTKDEILEMRLLSKQETAKVLGCCLRTVDTMIAKGELPVVRYCGGCVRVSPESLRKFIEENTK